MTDTKHTDSRYLICEKCHKRQYERGQTYTPGNNCECFGFKPKHTDSVEAVGSLLYEVKQQILWDYSYYVSREQSVNGYWKRVSSIEDIPTHAVSTHRTHPVHEPDNLFLFKIYQYLLNHQQQVEEARETGYREGFAKASELAHESHQKQVEEAVRKATKVATIEAWNDAIELSDQLEESNTKFDEWRAFKGFRNGLRDKIRALVETPNHQD